MDDSLKERITNLKAGIQQSKTHALGEYARMLVVSRVRIEHVEKESIRPNITPINLSPRREYARED